MAHVDLPLVMIWRQISNLDSAKAVGDGMLSLTPIGEDDDSVMYDAGSVIVGFFGRDEFQRAQHAQAASLLGADPVAAHAAARAAVASQCSGLNFAKVDLVTNPATNVVFATRDLQTPRARLREEGVNMRVASVKTAVSESVPFFDDDGNQFSLSHFSEQATTSAKGFFGVKLGGLLQKRNGEESRLMTINLMVSDMAKSEAFYADVLGLERLEGAEDSAAYDLGTSVLVLHPETAPRLVRSISRSGRLKGDWFVLYAKNIAEEVKKLQRRGISFPLGIEPSATGQTACFDDPDGYTLVLWQPPEDESLPMKKIKFFPVLNRILKEVV